jgi:Cu/Ag efflux protein CusF
MKSPRNSSQRLALFSLCALLTFSAACNRGKSAPGATDAQSAAKRYALKGKVISIDKQAGTANINNEPIPGFMDPMVMPYAIKPPAMLDQLQPCDAITADVVVQANNSYWLENIKVTAHSSAGKMPGG